jgi:hypothetical protein
MISLMIVVIDEPADAGFEVTRQVVVFQQDSVLQRLMPAFDLALCLRMVGRAANVPHVLCIQPFSQISRDVAGAIIAEQARLQSCWNLPPIPYDPRQSATSYSLRQLWIARIRSVVRLSGDNCPHASTRILDVTGTARDQMNVGVVNCLPSCTPIVNADVEASDQRVLYHYLLTDLR